MKTATLSQLQLDNAPFPEWFIPRYMVKDIDTCWWVYSEEPRFDGKDWVNVWADIYEIGIEEADPEEVPCICRGLDPVESLFKIIGD